MEVKEQLEVVAVPSETCLLIPTVCSQCGEEYDLNDALTILACVNPFCSAKLVQRAVSMCEVLDIKDFGESFFRAYFTGTSQETLSSLLTLTEDSAEGILTEYDEDDTGVSYETFSKRLFAFTEVVSEKRKTLTLPLYVRALSLPNLKTRADGIFADYDSLASFYSDLELASTFADFARLFKVTESSVETILSLVSTFGEYKFDALQYELRGFNFYVPVKGDIQLKVVCSKAVGQPFRSKTSFYRYVDENYAEKVNVQWSNSATKSCDVLIWAGVDGSDEITRKVSTICKFNRQGSHIPILSAQQFLSLLESASDGQGIKDTLDAMEIIDYEI